MTAGQRQDNPELEQPLVSHLLELRDRLLRVVAAIFIIFLCLFPFANSIYAYVAQPLMVHLPEGTSMIATEVASPFLTPFKLSLVAAVFLAMPYILYQLWGFIAPGLYKHEKRLATPLLVSSILLFYVGMLFAYYVVFPLIFGFLTGTAPDGVAVMTDISHYLDFVLTLFFAFGVAFEVPIAIILLVWMGVVKPNDLASKRPYIVVAAFVVGMLLTPPDVISQTLLAVPMLILFEVGIWVSKWFVRDANPGADAEIDDKDVVVFRTPALARPSARPTAAAATAAESLIGSDLAAGAHDDPDRFVPMTDQEMEDELAAIEAQEEAAQALPDGEEEGEEADVDVGADADTADPAEIKLRQVQALRGEGNAGAARSLLYEVLEQGNADQRMVARNILDELDTP